MLGYSRERAPYRLVDIDSGTIIEERNVKFVELIKGSQYIKQDKNDGKYQNWDIKNLLNISDILLSLKQKLKQSWLTI